MNFWPYRWHILHEDQHILLVSKPAGLPTQAPLGIDNLESQVRKYLSAKVGAEKLYLGVPHRLDRPVSGPVVFGLDRKATQRLAAQFEARTVKKRYWACVEGVVTPAGGTWTDHIRKIPDRAQVEIVWPDHPEGRVAVLHYRTLGSCRFGSWLEIELETGRMHQIRIQTAARGCPVVGDTQYGARAPFGDTSLDALQSAIALHGRMLGFRHPRLPGSVEVTVPLPPAWEALGLKELPPSLP